MKRLAASLALVLLLAVASSWFYVRPGVGECLTDANGRCVAASATPHGWAPPPGPGCWHDPAGGTVCRIDD